SSAGHAPDRSSLYSWPVAERVDGQGSAVSVRAETGAVTGRAEPTPLHGGRLLLAWLVVAVLAVGGAVQLYVVVHQALNASYSAKSHPIVGFLSRARTVIPQSAVFANTPTSAEQLRYGLFPRIQHHVLLSDPPGVVRTNLARWHVTYVVVNRADPNMFSRDTGPWWHVVLRQGPWRVIAVSP
ncbi:MAG TPA: hypothetical protein VFJ24_03070, partial [Gaiellales bacterium]|nr:hypothetical protein [Gaiellales bacterium]